MYLLMFENVLEANWIIEWLNYISQLKVLLKILYGTYEK